MKSLSERFVLVSNKSGEGVGMVESNSYNQALAKGKLVFNRYGNRYFLDEIWKPNADSHLKLVETPSEQHIRKELILASRKAAPQTMREVALR